MSVETIIRHRTCAKEIRLSGELVMTKADWLARGGVYHGTLRAAASEGYYTVRSCEKIGQPVTADEFANCKDFAMFQGCYTENAIYDKNFILQCPCLPVFYRGEGKE